MVQIRQQMALELMREADIGTVQEIEREIFSTPWPRNAITPHPGASRSATSRTRQPCSRIARSTAGLGVR